MPPVRRVPLPGTLTSLARANPRAALTAVVGAVMIGALILVTTLFSRSAPAGSGSTADVGQVSVLSDEHGWQVAGVAFSPGGQTVAGSFRDAAGSVGEVDLWDSNGQRQGPPLTAETAKNVVSGIAFSPTDRTRLAVGDQGTVDLWNLAGNSAQAVRVPGSGVVVDVGYAPDGKTIAAGDNLGRIRLLNAASGDWLATSFTDPDVAKDAAAIAMTQIAVSPAGTLLADVNSRGNVYIWRVAGGAPTVVPSANPQAADALAFSPDGGKLAIAGPAGVQVRSVATWKVTTTLAGPDKAPQAVAFSPDGKTLAVADADGSVYLWDLATSHEKHIATQVSHWGGLAFSPDGKTLAAFGYQDTKVYLYGIKPA